MLANLQKLHLEDGSFITAGLPAHITELTLESADVSDSYGYVRDKGWSNNFMTSIRKLRISDSVLSGRHPCGVLAFSGLEVLHFVKSKVAADTPENKINLVPNSYSAEAICLPVDMSALNSLSQLVLALSNEPGKDEPGKETVDLAPLHALSLLQHLCVQPAGVNLCLSAELSTLQKLTSLHLQGIVPDWGDAFQLCPFVSLDVEWSSLHALQHLNLTVSFSAALPTYYN